LSGFKKIADNLSGLAMKPGRSKHLVDFWISSTKKKKKKKSKKESSCLLITVYCLLGALNFPLSLMTILSDDLLLGRREGGGS